MSLCDYLGDPALKDIFGCGSPAPVAAPTIHPPGISPELDDQLKRASMGNATLYTAAVAQAQSEQADLQRLQDQTGWCDYTLGACDAVSNLANNVGSAAKTAVATIGLVQIGLVAIAGFALYKILSSDTARQDLVEIVKAK